MIEFAAFRFLTPTWLLLLPPLWYLLWMFAKYHLRPSMWNRICDSHLLNNMQFDGRRASGFHWLIWTLAIVFTLAIVAAAGPSWRQQSGPLMESANARIIVLDLSRAMRVQDLKPNRFAHAIAATREIINADFEGETGLVVFAGAAFVVSPLSRDTNTLLAFVDAFEPGILPIDGLRVDLAIESAQDLLRASITGRGQIVIVTSGSDHPSRALQAALAARNDGNQVSIMAIGTTAGAPLIDDNGVLAKDGSGRVVLAKTNFNELEEITNTGNGLFLTLSRSTAYDALLGSRIRADNLVEASNARQNHDREAANDGIWLVWLLLPFALLLFRKNLVWVFLVTIMLPLDEAPHAAEQASIWQHPEQIAIDAYRQGNFTRSAKLSSRPGLKGAAHYRNGNYQQAAELFALDDTPLSHYNRGNALAWLDRLADAIAAYDQALALDPGLEQARYNKRLLELYLQQLQDSEDDQVADSGEESDNSEEQAQADSEGRFESGEQGSSNPGDEQSLESGFGASAQIGQLDPFEQFDFREQQPERFTPGENFNRAQIESIVNNWILNLPAASSELFKNKFLRDYERQQRQQR